MQAAGSGPELSQGLKIEVNSRILLAHLSLCTEIHSWKSGRKLFTGPGSYTCPVTERSCCPLIGQGSQGLGGADRPCPPWPFPSELLSSGCFRKSGWPEARALRLAVGGKGTQGQCQPVLPSLFPSLQLFHTSPLGPQGLSKPSPCSNHPQAFSQMQIFCPVAPSSVSKQDD